LKLVSTYKAIPFIFGVAFLVHSCSEPKEEKETSETNSIKATDTTFIISADTLVESVQKLDFEITPVELPPNIRLDIISPSNPKGVNFPIQKFSFKRSLGNQIVGAINNNDKPIFAQANYIDVFTTKTDNIIAFFDWTEGKGSNRNTHLLMPVSNEWTKGTPLLYYISPLDTVADKNIVLDFFAYDVDFSTMKIKATIDETQTFYITENKPHYISELPKGKHSLRLQLVNSKNEAVFSPFNDSGYREFLVE
jgi:hypothetical protein